MISYSKSTETYYHNRKEITKEEYYQIKFIIENKPVAPEGYDYRLTENLNWEIFQLPTEETEESEV